MSQDNIKNNEQPGVEQQKPEGDLSSIITGISELKERLDELQHLEDQEGQDFQDEVDRLLKANLAHPAKETNATEMLFAAMRDASKGELKHYIEANFEQLLHDLEQVNVLAAKADALAQRKWGEEQELMRDRIDWGSLIDDYVSGSISKDITLDLAEITKFLTAPSEHLGYAALQPSLSKIQEYKALLEEKYTLENPHQAEEDAQFNQNEYRQFKEEWKAATSEATSLLSNARRDNLREALGRLNDRIDRFELLLKEAEYYDPEASQKKIIPVLAQALKHALEQSFRTVDQSDEAFIQHESKTRPTAPSLSGLNMLAKTTGLADPAAWVYQHLNRYPEWFTSGLDLIEFREPTKLAPEELAKIDWEAGGSMNVDENKIELANFRKLYEELLLEIEKADSSYSMEDLHGLIIRKINHGLAHEVAHYGHFRKIPLGWLRRWIEVTKREGVFVSDYAEAVDTYSTESSIPPVAEGLADSLAYYINEPKKLIEITAERFELIQELLQIYPQENIETILHEAKDSPERAMAALTLVPRDELPEIIKQLKDL